MSTIPTVPAPQAPPTETIEQRFRRLETTWFNEIGYSSSPNELCSHRAFREIVRMGEAVVPLMLRDLEERPRLWVWALPEITGADAAAECPAGNITEMSKAWVRWGKEHGDRW